MALMMDALSTPEEIPIIQESKPATPRYIVELRNKHGYHPTIGRLEFGVCWVGSNAADTLKFYSNLQHLHVLTEYEERMPSLTQGKGRDDSKCIQQRQSRSLRKNILQRDREAAAMLTDDDTDSYISELGEVL
jgi:hypothetical protein